MSSEPVGEANRVVQAVVDAIPQPALVLRPDLSLESANGAFYKWFQVEASDHEARQFWDDGRAEWVDPQLRSRMKGLASDGNSVNDYRIEYEFERLGRRVLILNACRLEGVQSDGKSQILVLFSDETEIDRVRFELTGQKEYAEKIVDAMRDPLLILGWDLRVKSANEPFYRIFHVEPGNTEGRLVYELGNGQWNIPRLRELLEEILPENHSFDDFEVEHEFEKIGRKLMILNARRINQHQWILLTIQDVTGQKRSEYEQKLLMGELQHRVKNILMNVQALARQTRRSSGSLEDFSRSFEGRLDALARTQDLLVRSAGDSARLEDLIRFELQALGAEGDPKLMLRGPKVELPSRVAQPLAMTVHELATNAAKYGALSTETGIIRINWTAEREGESCIVRINWREYGVRLPTRCPRRGFGTELIEGSLSYLFGGSSRLSFHEDGVECQIEFVTP